MRKPLSIFLGIFKIIKGTLASFKLILRYKPDFIIGFGSYYSLPVLLAGIILKVDIVIHEQNVVPGKVNALFSRFVKVVGLTFPDVYNLLKCKKKAVVTLNKTIISSKENKEVAPNFYENRKVLLVFGGSLGSVAINKIFLSSLSSIIKQVSNLSVIHIVGDNERIDEVKEVYSKLEVPSIVKSFEKNMSFYFQISHLAICRAGSGTLKELIYYELPAIMIPYPYAYNHQEKNALFFQKDVKGGFFVREKDVNSLELANIIVGVLNTSKLSFYRANLSKYKNNYESKDFLHFINKSLS